MAGQPLVDFLQPLAVDLDKLLNLAKHLSVTYRKLAAEAENQFLATPIPNSILRPSVSHTGRYLAIDIGGTNLRVGFIELSIRDNDAVGTGITRESCVRRLLEKAWPIGDHLKNEKAEDLFEWIGACIAEVVEDGLRDLDDGLPPEVLMGVTFSFPMIQHNITEATLMSMGKGFAITSNLNLGEQLRAGYAKAASYRTLPKVKIAAIVNDAVATLVSFMYQLKDDPRRKAAMGLIVGTGNNATIPLKLESLHPNKISKLDHFATNPSTLSEERMVINTEWSINGTAPTLHDLKLITLWDEVLDMSGEAPGFMPFEYMTSGRYLGELGRLMILDYLTDQLGIPATTLPTKLRTRNGLTTSFLGNLGFHKIPFDKSLAVRQLSQEFPPDDDLSSWQWSPDMAEAFYTVGKKIQERAAGMTAAAIAGLLACAGDICLDPVSTVNDAYTAHAVQELIVGYTGGCIVHFQDYLADCQRYLDAIMETISADNKPLRIVLQACNDGGIIGAGVLAGAAKSLIVNT
ncbi:MAG: hypothetical protein M1818_006130 [Claussenomyces sp. TS43310]|nr:MAG: hypothetical protein M1818_006130 [Claussenomyces sp. TS43310]